MDLAGEGIFVALAAVMAGLGQLWFWRLRLGEERTVWLGCAALVAAGTAAIAVSLLLVALFPRDVFPWVQTLVLAILAIFFIFLLMFPIALVVTLIATGIRLIRREGRSFHNMLSLGLGCAMVDYVTIWPFVRSALGDVPVFGNVFRFHLRLSGHPYRHPWRRLCFLYGGRLLRTASPQGPSLRCCHRLGLRDQEGWNADAASGKPGEEGHRFLEGAS